MTKTSLTNHRLPRIITLSLLMGVQALAHAADATTVNLPPSAELQYTIQAKQSGFPISGSALVKWQLSGKEGEQKYRAHNETRASLFGKIVENNSRGSVDEHGLVPEQFTEKRFGKDPTTTTFDQGKKRISFSASPTQYDIKGGEQDRVSATWQLVSLARAAGDKFAPGTDWKMQVAYIRDADPWTFKVEGKETVTTALGKVETLHVVKLPPPDSKDQKTELWLAPSLDWYPVRMRFNDADGNFVDQVLEKIVK